MPYFKNKIVFFNHFFSLIKASVLYKGVSSPLVGSMLINAVLFGVEENVRRRLFSSRSHETTGQYKFFALSGAIAGLTQSFMLSPVELIKTKMQLSDSKYRNTWECTRDVLTKGNCLRNLTRGTSLTILRDVPGVSSYFISFEFICDSYNKPRGQLSVLNLLMAGGLAGCFSWIVTYPIDVIKTRYQIDSSYSNARDCLMKSIARDGPMVLWRGLAPTLLRYSIYKTKVQLFFTKITSSNNFKQSISK
jgi:solute carrier family 25 carnitine/acylcarnitine transporter 20/29